MLNSIINADCISVMKDMEDGYIDLCLTDPPYGINLKPNREGSKFHKTLIENDNDLSWVREFYSELFRVTKNVSYIFCGWSTVDTFMIKAREAGFIHKNTIVWDKMHFGMGWNFRPQHEFILVLCKDKFMTKDHNVPNLLHVKRMHHTKMVHVAEKPVELLSTLIEQASDEGDIIFDPFSGSGSTLVAASKLNRNYIGVELDKTHFELARDRLKEQECLLKREQKIQTCPDQEIKMVGGKTEKVATTEEG